MRERASAKTVICRVSSVVEMVASRHGVPTLFKPGDSFVDGGLTSVGMVELMLAIEEAFDVGVPDSELNATNFLSIASLSALVSRLVAGRPQAGSAPIGVNDLQQFQSVGARAVG